MIVQNPWEVTKKLPPKAQTCVNIGVINSNGFTLVHSTFVGTYAAWLLKGGQELVNLEHLVAGLLVFISALLVGDRNLFSKRFAIKVAAYRLVVIAGEVIPLFFAANTITVMAVVSAAALYPLMKGYYAERNAIIWGRRPDALKDRQSFEIRLHPLEMAVVALGGIVGMTLVPSIKAMVIANVLINVICLFADIYRNYLVEDIRVSTGYDKVEESE
jgi:hypothetical protein